LQCFTHPGGDMDAVATRFTLPVRALAFSPSGLNLAAGGDDEGIKLVDISTCKIFRQLPSQVRQLNGGPAAGGGRLRLLYCCPHSSCQTRAAST
jgi:WD40 repeat protein